MYGQSIRDAASLVLAEPAEDSTQPTLEVDWQDNAGEARTAVTIMQKQLMQKPDIYLSGLKPQTMAIKEQVASSGVPHWMWVFDTSINSGNKAKNNFRTYLNFKVEPPVVVDYAKNRKAKRVAILYVRLPSTEEEYEKVLVPALKRTGITDILVQPYDISTKDFKSFAVKVSQFKPDLIVLSAFQEGFVAIVRAFRPMGLVKDGQVLASYDMIDAARVLGKDELEGLRVTAPTFMIAPQNQAVVNWSAKFRKKLNREPLYTDFYAYDAFKMIGDAAKRMPPDRTAIEWCKKISSTESNGLTGSLAFDEDNSLKIKIAVAKFDNGKLVPADTRP